MPMTQRDDLIDLLVTTTNAEREHRKMAGRVTRDIYELLDDEELREVVAHVMKGFVTPIQSVEDAATYHIRKGLIQKLSAATDRSERLIGKTTPEFWENLETHMLKTLAIVLFGDDDDKGATT